MHLLQNYMLIMRLLGACQGGLQERTTSGSGLVSTRSGCASVLSRYWPRSRVSQASGNGIKYYMVLGFIDQGFKRTARGSARVSTRSGCASVLSTYSSRSSTLGGEKTSHECWSRPND